MSDSERIPTNLRTLLILEIVGQSDFPLSPTEINGQLGLPKQSIHRLCATLVEEGFLAYEPSGKRLRPARRARLMGSGILYSSRKNIARRQILQNVARIMKETVNFVVPEENGMAYYDRVETDWPFRVQLPIGTNVPFHCTASGKAFLSTLSRSARQKMINSLWLEKRTNRTITDPELLLDEVKEIAKQGYSIDNEEFMDGMAAMAVPVRDSKGRFLAALAVHGPTIRIDIDNLIARKSVLFDAAERLSAALIDN